MALQIEEADVAPTMVDYSDSFISEHTPIKDAGGGQWAAEDRELSAPTLRKEAPHPTGASQAEVLACMTEWYSRWICPLPNV